MHQRNNHEPYRSTADALLYWPETATAVAVRISSSTLIEIVAPYGLDDLFALRLRATPLFEGHKQDIFWQRVVEKGGWSAIRACSLSLPHRPARG